MGWNYLSIPKLQRCNRWSLEMDKQFHLTLCQVCDYLSMLGLKLNHVSKRGHWWTELMLTCCQLDPQGHASVKVELKKSQKSAFEHVVCRLSAILFRLQHIECSLIYNKNIHINKIREYWTICKSPFCITLFSIAMSISHGKEVNVII